MATTEATDNGFAPPTESDLHLATEDPYIPVDITADSALHDVTIESELELELELEQSAENPNESECDTGLAQETDVLPSGAVSNAVSADNKWPGWPGNCVFRLIVPVVKVGSIIGRKGELIKKMCEETRARVRVLEGAIGTPDRIVLISGKEEPELSISPAMDAVIRIFKRVSGLSESEGDGELSEAAGVAFCSVRLLVPSTQAISLIGKQGSLIKSIQESTGVSLRVLSGEEVPLYAAADERIIEFQGEALKVLKALEAVVGHLRKFLVDQSVLPLFEKMYTTSSQERPTESWSDKSALHNASQSGIGSDYPLAARRESMYLDHESQLESQVRPSGFSLYRQDPAHSGYSSGLGRTGASIVTQMAQTMQIPLSYAEDIIGIGGTNIAYIRRTSGAILTVQESRSLPDEITVEIKGTSQQVQTAQQLIQEFISSHRDPVDSGYGNRDPGLRSAYRQLGSSSYPSSSLPSQTYGGYGGSSGVGGYSSYRL